MGRVIDRAIGQQRGELVPQRFGKPRWQRGHVSSMLMKRQQLHDQQGRARAPATTSHRDHAVTSSRGLLFIRADDIGAGREGGEWRQIAIDDLGAPESYVAKCRQIQ
jgi:hypothetical protein